MNKTRSHVPYQACACSIPGMRSIGHCCRAALVGAQPPVTRQKLSRTCVLLCLLLQYNPTELDYRVYFPCPLSRTTVVKLGTGAWQVAWKCGSGSSFTSGNVTIVKSQNGKTARNLVNSSLINWRCFATWQTSSNRGICQLPTGCGKLSNLRTFGSSDRGR